MGAATAVHVGSGRNRIWTTAIVALAIFAMLIMLPMLEIPWLRLDHMRHTSRALPARCIIPPSSECVDYASSELDIAQPYANLLASEYEFTLPLEMRRQAQVSLGDRTRFRNFVRKLAAGQPVHVGFIGGSITDGGGAAKDGQSDYMSAFRMHFLEAVAPNSTIYYGGIPATFNKYFASCMEIHIGPEADIVFVEMAINDRTPMYGTSEEQHEHVLRKILSLPRRPPAVNLMFHRFHEFFQGRAAYLQTNADAEAIVSQYYGQPVLGYRSALWDALARNESGFRLGDFMGTDMMHPTNLGHRFMTDLIVQAIRDEAAAMGADEPWGAGDEEAMERPLPPPMHSKLVGYQGGRVLVGEELRALAAREETRGFVWADVGKGLPHPKQGWQGRGQGSRLSLRYNSTELAQGAALPFVPALSIVGYLRDSAGQALTNMTCAGPCTCREVTLMPSVFGRFRQVFGISAPAMPTHENCLIQFTMIDENPQNDRFDLVAMCVMNAA